MGEKNDFSNILETDPPEKTSGDLYVLSLNECFEIPAGELRSHFNRIKKHWVHKNDGALRPKYNARFFLIILVIFCRQRSETNISF